MLGADGGVVVGARLEIPLAPLTAAFWRYEKNLRVGVEYRRHRIFCRQFFPVHVLICDGFLRHMARVKFNRYGAHVAFFPKDALAKAS